MLCPGDGIGRHARLKIWWLHGRMGSSPIPGKKLKDKVYENKLFLFYKNKIICFFL